MPEDRTGLLIIRAWVETGSAIPLRAFIRSTDDVAAGSELTSGSTLTDVDAIGALVKEWIEEVLSAR